MSYSESAPRYKNVLYPRDSRRGASACFEWKKGKKYRCINYKLSPDESKNVLTFNSVTTCQHPDHDSPKSYTIIYCIF